MMAAQPMRIHSDLTAVVYAADGVRFVATATRPEQLAAKIGGYIRERCDYVLWADDARETRELLEGGNPYAAIALYFERVGDRWDEERLELSGGPLPSRVTSPGDFTLPHLNSHELMSR